MPAVRAPSRLYPTPVRLPAGPWIGVRDAPEPNVSKGGKGESDDGGLYLLDAINMYLTAGPFGKAWEGRPGCTPMVEDVETDELGGGGTGQALYTWTQETGTRITIGICGGKFYTYNWSSNIWTETLDATALSGASITLSSTARVALTPFAGVLHVSDGVNTPWTWDGTSGSGLTKLTNSPVLYGQPRVYYAKLVAIKASERNTIVWSEEATPNTGYEAGGYNNAWTIGQATNANLLYALAATNEALVVYRERATTSITGAINDDFQTTGTRSSISETIGTRSPWAVGDLQEAILSLSADAKPHGVVQAVSMVKLWKDCQATTASILEAALANAMVVRDLACNVLLVGVAITSTVLDTFLTFNLETGQYQGRWSGFTFDVVGELIDDDGKPRWAHFGHSDGIPMLHALPDGSTWNDELPTGTLAISHSAKPRPMFRDLGREVQVDRIEFGLGQKGSSQVTISYKTTRGIGGSQSVSVASVASGAMYGVSLYGTGVYGGSIADRRAEVGCQNIGRWVVPELRHVVLNETLSVTDCRVSGFEVAADPGVP